MRTPFESEQVTGGGAEKEIKYLDPEFAARLIFLSFRFSQGDPDLQNRIINAITREHPEWRMNEEVQKKIGVSLSKMIKGFFDRNSNIASNPHTRDNIALQTISYEENKGIHFLKEGLSNSSFLKESSLQYALNKIAERILDLDEKYLISKDGRKRPLSSGKNNQEVSPTADKWLSHFCRYVLEGAPTGMKEYDELFAKVKKHVVTEGFSDKTYYERLRMIVAKYNSTHPGKEIELEGLFGRESDKESAKT